MEIRHYGAVVRKWLWLILAGILISGGVAYFASQRAEETYRATTVLLVQQNTNQELYSSQYQYSTSTSSVAELIKQPSVMQEVVSKLNEIDPSLSYTRETLAKVIVVETDSNTSLIRLSAKHWRPSRAALIANTTAGIFVKWYQETFVSQANQSLATINSQIAALEAMPDRTADEEAELEQLQLLQSAWTAELGRAMVANAVVVMEPASAPSMPLSRNTWRNVALACALGLILTIGSAFFIEYMDRSVKTSEDVIRLTGLPILGAIVRFKKDKKDKKRDCVLMTEVHPKGAVLEGYRKIRANLQFVGLDKPLHTIAVTSAGMNEGKSTVTANLAIALAQAGRRVILVDCDLRHPTQHHFFHLSNTRGFTNMLRMRGTVKASGSLGLTGRPLAEQVDLSALLQPTDFEGLRVLTAGTSVPNPAELLGSPRVDFIRDQLKREADVVIFDTAPTLAVADTAILAAKVDGVIMVVEVGSTTGEALTEAKESLIRGSANVIGVVLNGKRIRGRSGYYYGYYGYYSYYGHHGHDGHDEKEEEGERQRPIAPTTSGEFVTRVHERLATEEISIKPRQSSVTSRVLGRFRKESAVEPTKKRQATWQPSPVSRLFSSIRGRFER